MGFDPKTVEALKMYADLRNCHDRLVAHTIELRADTHLLDVADTIDITYILQQADKMVVAAGREMRKTARTLAKVGCVLFLAEGTADTIRANFASGKPDIKDIPKIPSMTDDPDGYLAMLEEMGVDPNGMAARKCMLTPRFKGIQEHIQHCEEMGEPHPFKTIPEAQQYGITTYKLSGFDLETEAQDVAK